MKSKLLIVISLLFVQVAFSQDITGDWNGLLKMKGTQLKLVVHINKTEKGFSSSMDIPDQGAKGVPVGQTIIEGASLQLLMPNVGAEFKGVFMGDSITGTFKQGGVSLPLSLFRNLIEKEVTRITQESQITKPYPYYSEDVTFKNDAANITLAGTLTLPKTQGSFPVVILISGSGRQNRDEEIYGRKPFLILADYLTKKGIAVLRYDDRGVAQSTGNFSTATSADFATDVESAVTYLKTRPEIDKSKIGLVGHSEGAMIAPMVAAKSKEISFIVLLAGPGMSCDKLLVLQQELISRAAGASEKEIQANKKISTEICTIIKNAKDNTDLNSSLKNQLKEYYKSDTAGTFRGGMTEAAWIANLTTPWMQYFLKYNPEPILSKVKCPVLALNGEKDLQVPPKENLAGIRTALKKAKNKKFTVKEMKGMNHFFQQCETGAPSEYLTIQETFSPIALAQISDWISNTVK